MDKVILNQAKNFLGMQQGDRRHETLIKNYNKVAPLPVGYPMKLTDDWCAAFVTVIADMAGASKYIGRECGVQRFVKIFKNKGIWLGVVEPRPGDIVVFDWQKNGWADHIGFVEEVKGNKITTIEGNTSRRVARRTYAYNDWRVAGFARPKYASISSQSNSVKTDTNVSKKRFKSDLELALEVVRGKWGVGSKRKDRLKKEGHNYVKIQKAVNDIMSGRMKPPSLNEIIAKEVIQGKWGNGTERKKSLLKEGYDYDAIQKIVNRKI